MSAMSAPILSNKNPASPSVFVATALLREARRQKGLAEVNVPPICILDPDGDIVRNLRERGRSRRFLEWPCYHTDLEIFSLAEQEVGIVGCAVGAPFAVLIAEELFASGCRVIISLTSAGQIVASGPTPYFVVIDRALRDEGTSYHYAEPAEYAEADVVLVSQAAEAIQQEGIRAIVGPSWTTDAPFRETALYTFARVSGAKVLCLAHVTNTMGQTGQDFEKGEADGTAEALSVLGSIVARLATDLTK
jgi:hypothetical protein